MTYSKYGSPELQAVVLARAMEKQQASTRTELIARQRSVAENGVNSEMRALAKATADMLEADGKQLQDAYDEGTRRAEQGFEERVRAHKEEARAYKEAYSKLIEKIASGKAFEPPPPIVMQSDDKLRTAARLALGALEGLFGIPNMHTGGGGGVAVWRLGGSYAPTQAIAALKEVLK